MWRIFLPIPSAGTSHTRWAALAPAPNITAPNPASWARCVRRVIVAAGPFFALMVLQIQRVRGENFVEGDTALAQALLMHILRDRFQHAACRFQAIRHRALHDGAPDI